MTEHFWLVWNPASVTPPTFRHPTDDSAIAEAGRLAALNPGETFFVLGAIGFASADQPVAHFMSLVGSEDFDETECSDPPAHLGDRIGVDIATNVGIYGEPQKGRTFASVDLAAEISTGKPSRTLHIRDLTGDLNNNSVVMPQLVGVTTLIVPDDAGGPGVVRGHSSIAAAVDRIVTESGRVLKDRNGCPCADNDGKWCSLPGCPYPKPGRVLEHGEYLLGDRIRFAGRFHNALPELRGRVGVFSMIDENGSARFVLDGDQGVRIGSVENIEHQSLPQFEIGDRVKVKPCGLCSVPVAAGYEATVKGVYAGGVRLRFDGLLTNRFGETSLFWTAGSEQIDLVRPVQAGGAA
jgi:hypothetical protein